MCYASGMETVTHATPAGTEVQNIRSGRWSRIERHSVSASGERFTHVRDLSGPYRGRVRRVLTRTLRAAL